MEYMTGHAEDCPVHVRFVKNGIFSAKPCLNSP